MFIFHELPRLKRRQNNFKTILYALSSDDVCIRIPNDTKRLCTTNFREGTCDDMFGIVRCTVDRRPRTFVERLYRTRSFTFAKRGVRQWTFNDRTPHEYPSSESVEQCGQRYKIGHRTITKRSGVFAFVSVVRCHSPYSVDHAQHVGDRRLYENARNVSSETEFGSVGGRPNKTTDLASALNVRAVSRDHTSDYIDSFLPIKISRRL